MVRKAMRKPAVLDALGWGNSTFYAAIKKGKFPKGTKLDPDGHVVVWFADQVEAFQTAAIERQSVAAAQ
jgi:predicted DNA-binding transcriptional regulator AlpA